MPTYNAKSVPLASGVSSKDSSQVVQALNSLEQNLCCLADRIKCLETSLTPVLLPRAPREDLPQQNEPILVPLASSIRNFAVRCGEIEAELGNIIERIQL